MSHEIKEAIGEIAQKFETARRETDDKITEVGKEAGEVKSMMAKVGEDLSTTHAELEELKKSAATAKTVDELKSQLDEYKEQIEKLSASAVYQAKQDAVSPADRERMEKHARNQVLMDFLKKHTKQTTEVDVRDLFAKEIEERKSVYVGNDPSAGYLADRPRYEMMFDANINEFSNFRSKAQTITLPDGTAYVERPANLKGGGTNAAAVGAAWEAEPVTRTDTGQPTVDKQQIFPHWARASVLISEQQIIDSYIDVEGWVTREAAENFALLEEEAFFNGTGATQPRGIMTLPATSADYKFIEQVPSGSASTFTTDGILQLIGQMKRPYHANAEFYVKRESLFTHLYTLKDNEDRYYLVPDWSQGLMFRLLGYPINLAPPMDTIEADALGLVFADLSRGYTIVDKPGLSILNDPYSNKPFIELWFRRRCGGDIQAYEAIKIQKIAAS